MSQEPSPAVVEFGPASGPPDTPEVRRPTLSRLLAGSRLDDRTVPALAGLGAVAVFVSLLSPWQATTINLDEFGGGQGLRSIDAGLSDLGGWAAAFLVGVFAVAACAALVLFSAPAVRQHARLAGLGVTGALLAMLVALAVELNRNSLIYPVYVPQEPDSSVRSGMYLALFGVAVLGVAQFLAGRLPAPASAGEDEDGGSATAGLWPWRRTRKAEAEPDEPLPPADLTVMPARPFVHGPESGGT
jgi:hypothetical protein